jgi:hypothetical protein
MIRRLVALGAGGLVLTLGVARETGKRRRRAGLMDEAERLGFEYVGDGPMPPAEGLADFPLFRSSWLDRPWACRVSHLMVRHEAGRLTLVCDYDFYPKRRRPGFTVIAMQVPGRRLPRFQAQPRATPRVSARLPGAVQQLDDGDGGQPYVVRAPDSDTAVELTEAPVMRFVQSRPPFVSVEAGGEWLVVYCPRVAVRELEPLLALARDVKALIGEAVRA